MSRFYERISMKHLMLVAFGFMVLGIIWTLGVWASSIDNLWMIPGVFLVISGITKAIAVQVWIRVAKLGTDQHKPIKAL